MGDVGAIKMQVFALLMKGIICDAIKQNKSELVKNRNSVLIYITLELYNTENPIKIKHTIPEI